MHPHGLIEYAIIIMCALFVARACWRFVKGFARGFVGGLVQELRRAP